MTCQSQEDRHVFIRVLVLNIIQNMLDMKWKMNIRYKPFPSSDTSLQIMVRLHFQFRHINPLLVNNILLSLTFRTTKCRPGFLSPFTNSQNLNNYNH